MIYFGDWEIEQAREYAELYAAAVPGRAKWLRREYEASGGAPELTGSRSDLLHLWAWLRDRIDSAGPTGVQLSVDLPREDPQLASAPPWENLERPNQYLSGGLLWLIDALGCYLAELTAVERPEVAWDVYRASNQRDLNQNRTRLFGVVGQGSVDPAQMVYGAVIGPVIHKEPWQDEALLDLYRYMNDEDWKPADIYST